MARYYANIQGNRGEATRMGSASSGIQAHPRGWNLGIRIDGGARGIRIDGGARIEDESLDEFYVDISRGSNGPSHGSIARLACVYEEDDGTVTVRLGSAFGAGTFRFDKAGNALTEAL